jgi:uncharacterized protein (DUF58 family)
MLNKLTYHLLRGLSSLHYWEQRRFTKAGLLALAALTASALGLDTNATVAYQAFALLAVLFALAWLTTFRFRPQFAVRRSLPRLGTVGQPLPYRLTLTNQSAAPLRSLKLFENLADPRPSLEEFLPIGEPTAEPEYQKSWGGAINHWRRLTAHRRLATVEPQSLPDLPPRGAHELRAHLLPRRRGTLRLRGVTLARPDPLGLLHALHTVPADQSVLILPKRYPVPPVPLPGTRAYQQGGVTLATSVGDSEEFVSLRDYRPGDPLRRIHWKSWSKVGKPIVKEYQEEFFVRHALILDTYLRTASPLLFEEAVSVAASFACTIETQESLLDLLFVGARAYCFTAGRGQGQVESLLEVLANVEPCTTAPFRTLHEFVTNRAAMMSGCICVLLSWNDERQQFVTHLRGLGIPVLALILTEGAAAESAAAPEPQAHPWLRRLRVGQIAEGLATL